MEGSVQEAVRSDVQHSAGISCRNAYKMSVATRSLFSSSVLTADCFTVQISLCGHNIAAFCLCLSPVVYLCGKGQAPYHSQVRRQPWCGVLLVCANTLLSSWPTYRTHLPLHRHSAARTAVAPPLGAIRMIVMFNDMLTRSSSKYLILTHFPWLGLHTWLLFSWSREPCCIDNGCYMHSCKEDFFDVARYSKPYHCILYVLKRIPLI